MRSVRAIVVVTLALVLSQCAQGPVASLQDSTDRNTWWSNDDRRTGPRAPRVERAAVEGAAVAREPITTGSTSRDLKPLSPEWYARERTIDDRLNRQLNICSRC